MNKLRYKIGTLLVIYIMIFLPISYAITISNESVNVQSNNLAIFSWNTDVSSTSKVEYGLTNAYGAESSAGAQVLTHTMPVMGLTPDTTYYYRISSTEISSSSVAQKNGTFKTPDSTPPPKPTNFNVTSKTKTSLSFSWDVMSASDFSKFKLYRNAVTIYEGGATTFMDTNLSAGITYTYEVSAFDVSGNEGEKNIMSVSTLPMDYTAPIIRNITLIDSQDTSAKISWTTDDNATSVIIYRTTNGINTAKTDGFSQTHEVTLTPLEKGAKVIYKISSCNEDLFCTNSTEDGFIAGKDILAPLVNVDAFDKKIGIIATNKETYDIIIGKTESFSKVSLWINSGFLKSVNSDENGTFSFNNVALDTSKLSNTLHFESMDKSKNIGKKDYIIILKFTSPKINATIPPIFPNRTITFPVTLSEKATVEVYLTPVNDATPLVPNALKATQSMSGVQLTWNKTNDKATYNMYKDEKLIGFSSSNIFTDFDAVINQSVDYYVTSLDDACKESAKSGALRVKIINATKPQKNPDVVACTVKAKDIQDREAGSFLQTIDLPDKGRYKIKLIARDYAENFGEYEKEILIDTEKPTLSEIYPDGSARYYTSSLDSVDITGKTSPNATVKLWILQTPDSKPDKITKADANGRFEFLDINFALAAISSTLSFDYYDSPNGSGLPRLVQDLKSKGGLDTTKADAIQRYMDKNKFYYLQAENTVGVKSDENNKLQPYTFQVMDCFSGNMSWTVTPRIEFQSPSFLSVERLSEGTERLGVFYEFTYNGPGDAATVKVEQRPQIRVKELDSGQQKSKKYNLTKKVGNIDFNTEVACDATNTKCYYLGRPPGIADLTKSWGFKDWKEALSAMTNTLVVPIEISITYTYMKDGKRTNPETQKVCKELKYSVDNTKVDFSKLPDWLMNGGIKFLNVSIDNLDKIIVKAKPIVKGIGYVCIGSIISKTGIAITRAVSERVAYSADKASKVGVTFTASQCYKGKDKKDKIEGAFGNNLPKKYMDYLSNQDLKNCYPKIAGIWEWEANADQVYRWSCDRIFCRSTPSPWTGKRFLPKDAVGGAEVKLTGYDAVAKYLQDKQMNYSTDCKNDMTVFGATMVKTECPKNKEEYMGGIDYSNYAGFNSCFSFEGAVWGIKPPSPDKGVYTMQLISQPKGGTLPKVLSSGQATLKAVAVENSGGDQLFTARPYSCIESCKGQGYGEKKGIQKWPEKITEDDIKKGNFDKVRINIWGKTETTKYFDCTYSKQGTLISKNIECPDKIDATTINKQDIINMNKNNAYYDNTGSCINEKDNPCQTIIDSQKKLKDNKGSLIDNSGGTNTLTFASGDSAAFIKNNECSKQIVGHKSGKNIGLTYGSDGEELNLYMNQNAEERKTNPYVCCCYSGDDKTYDDGLIKPYYNDGISAGTKNFNNKDSTKDENIERWDYRYSKTGIIYPNYKDVEKTSGTVSTGTGAEGLQDTPIMQQRRYHPKLYFKDRDQTSSFGQDNFFYGTNKDRLDPQTDYSSTLQTLCLTGILKKLSALRNILAGVRNCLQSVKYSGQYQSAACKEIFSKYVCSFASDIIVMAVSGCSPYGKSKTADLLPENSDLKTAVSAFGGISEGIESSIGDLKNDYSNTDLTNMLGGGSQGFMEKACMAAFGYDWGLSMDSLLDIAYNQEMASTVQVIAPRKEHLFINPTSAKPMSEYRGAVYIIPGCDIQGYTVETICLTRTEQLDNRNRGVNCGVGTTLGAATANYKCNCLNNNNPNSPSYQVLSGGFLKSGQPLETAFHKVPEVSQTSYVYDHIKVKLLWDKNKYKKCMPEGYEEGVFYFPIPDRTPVTSLGCVVVPQTGEVRCSQGSLAQALGFGNAQINEIIMDDNYYVGELLKVKPLITKTGDGLSCLKLSVYKSNPDVAGAQLQFPAEIKELREPTTAQSEMKSYSLYGGQPIPQDWLGAFSLPQVTYTTTPAIKQTQGVIPLFTVLEQPTISKSVEITLIDVNQDGKFECNVGDQYRLSGEIARPWTGNCEITTGGARIQINNFIPNGDDQETLKKGNVREVNLKFFFPSASSASSVQTNLWVLAEILTPDKNSNDTCTNAKSITNAQASTMRYPKSFFLQRVRTGANGNEVGDACDTSGVVQNKPCKCGSGEINCGSIAQGEYCYKKDGSNSPVCQSDKNPFAVQQTTQQIINGFGNMIITDETYNTPITKQVTCAADKSCVELSKDKTYQLLIKQGLPKESIESIKIKFDNLIDSNSAESSISSNELTTKLGDKYQIKTISPNDMTGSYKITITIKPKVGDEVPLPTQNIMIPGTPTPQITDKACENVNGHCIKENECKSPNTLNRNIICPNTNVCCIT